MLYQDSLSTTILQLANTNYNKHRSSGGSFAILQFDWDDSKTKLKRSGKKDPEDAFCRQFGKIVEEWGKPTDVIFVTMYTPCDRVCSEQIGRLAFQFPFIRRILIFFFEVYRGEAVEANSSAIDKLGTGVLHSEQNKDDNPDLYTMIRSEMLIKDKKSGASANQGNLKQNQKRLDQVTSARLAPYFSD